MPLLARAIEAAGAALGCACPRLGGSADAATERACANNGGGGADADADDDEDEDEEDLRDAGSV